MRLIGAPSVSKTCLVRFDNTTYSVAVSAVGRYRLNPRLKGVKIGR
jgi:hypothetical protein